MRPLGLQTPTCVYLIRTVLGDSVMARRRSRREDNTFTSDAAGPVYVSSSLSLLRAMRAQAEHLQEIEDRRRWDPMGDDAPARHIGGFTRVVESPNVNRKQARSRPARLHSMSRTLFAFDPSKRVMVCIRRKIRREVMHALRLRNKVRRRGGSGARRNWRSQIKC